MIKIEGKKFDWFGLTQILKEHVVGERAEKEV